MTDSNSPQTHRSPGAPTAPGTPAVPPPPGPVATPAPGARTASTTDQSTADQAKSAAKDVAGDTKDAARSVAGTAKSEAVSVKDDALREGASLLREAQGALSSQASDQVQRLSGAVSSVSSDLDRLSRGEQLDQGVTTELAGQLNARVQSAASWLEGKEPADLLDELKGFARRRPLAFLGIAAGVGLLAGRLTRGAVENHTDLGSDGSDRRDTGISSQGRYAYDATAVPAPELTRTTTGTSHVGTADAGVSHTGTRPGVAPAQPHPLAQVDRHQSPASSARPTGEGLR